jgi:hypothetical protein
MKIYLQPAVLLLAALPGGKTSEQLQCPSDLESKVKQIYLSKAYKFILSSKCLKELAGFWQLCAPGIMSVMPSKNVTSQDVART